MGLMVQRLLSSLRTQLFEHIQGLSLSFFDKSKTGDLIARFTNDIQVLQEALNVGITGPFRDIPLVFILTGMMIYRSWQLSLFLLIIIPIALLCILSFGKRNKRGNRPTSNQFWGTGEFFNGNVYQYPGGSGIQHEKI